MHVYEVRSRKDRRAACYGTTICPITFVPVGAINEAGPRAPAARPLIQLNQSRL